jgi:intermediate peptidase
MLARSARTLVASSKTVFRFRGCLHVKHASTATADERTIVSIFDSPQVAFKYPSSASTGLFGHTQLSHPSAFISLADATLLRAQLVTNRILSSHKSRDELLKVVKNLDRLSDMLCSVIDLAELIRNAHPDRNWVAAGNHVYEKLCEFMNVLNTHVGLYKVSDAGTCC